MDLTWWQWTLIVWALASFPIAILVGKCIKFGMGGLGHAL
jgi:hypothetical protein